MRSARPKPLHHLCGRPMVVHVLDATATGDDVIATVMVIGHGAELVEKTVREQADGETLRFVEQREQLGTGHAVSVALPTIDEIMGDREGHVLIVPGDTPLLRASTIQALLTQHEESGAALTVLTAVVNDPSGYGRIIYGRDGKVAKITEERDASETERQIHEINTSIMVVRRSLLGAGLRMVGRQNAQNEYYLTDLINVLYEGGHLTQSFVLEDASEAAGVNDRAQLASAERELRRRINDRWLRRGVTMWDPATTYIDADVQLSPDVSLLPGTILKGHTQIGGGAQIGPNAFLTDVVVGERAVVGTVEATAVSIGVEARVDSFASLERGQVVSDGTYGPARSARP